MCAISKDEMELDSYAADINEMTWMNDGDKVNKEDLIEIEDTAQVRANEAFMFKRTQDDDSISTFNNTHKKLTSNMSRAEPENDSPTKKKKKNSTTKEDCNMDSADNTEQVHTYEILLEDKEQEILSLRQRLEALSASKDNQPNEITQNTHPPDSQDREPMDQTGAPPGPLEGPGEGL